jgi:predicted TPR repeat methyltransferase
MTGATKTSDQLLREANDLDAAGRRAEAAAIYGELLAGPRHAEALKALGRISFENGDLEAAAHFLGEAVKVAPDFVDGYHLRGVALMRLGRNADALDCLGRAVALAPNFKEAILNHATLLLEMKRPNEALAGFDRLLSLEPDNAVGWNNRGNALAAVARLEDAVAAYDRALALDPHMDPARHNRFYALLSLRRVDRISDFAVRQAFDAVAPRYDQTMFQELDYRGHIHLHALARRVLGPLVPSDRILDLGCGTGLAGACFKDTANGGKLDGVDISPAMIGEARGRGIYDQLIVADIESFLAAPGPSYRLILSADAMVYLGDLTATFMGVAKRLEPGGAFLFTCEAKQGDGWELTEANRFRHSEAYLRIEAERAGLSWLDLMECTPRTERAEPVAGFAIALAKSKTS